MGKDKMNAADEEEIFEGDDVFYDDDAADNEEPQGFEVRGKHYVIRLTKKRIELYEQRHKPVMASFIQNEGAFSCAELSALLAYGLQLEGGAFVQPDKGMKMAEHLISSNGYLVVYKAVMLALKRDCGFLFKA